MKRYIAIDPGKYATKCAYLVQNEEGMSTVMFKFRTKVSDGNFNDDALEPSTMVVEYGGKVYKVGRGALHEAELSTNKMDELHRICTLAAIAGVCSENEVDEVHAAIGVPVKEWEIVEKREQYKKFMLPDDDVIEIRMMSNTCKEPVVKRFKIVSRHAYPESQGAIFLKNVVRARNAMSSSNVGVVDIGNLNINLTLWDNAVLDQNASMTGELGGNILISGLSQKLSAVFSRCSEATVASVLRMPYEARKLKPMKPNPELEEKSHHIISDHLLEHVTAIKRKCDVLQWDYDFMPMVFIGGTSTLLEREIREVFGEDAYVPNNPEYANVAGFLRVLCSKELNIIIPLPKIEDEKEEVIEESK